MVVVLVSKVVICGVEIDDTDYSYYGYMVGTAMAISFLISWTFKFEVRIMLFSPFLV